jgi:hypothetical protein
MMKLTRYFFVIGFFLLAGCKEEKATAPISLFPLKNYNQQLSHWINPEDSHYDQPVINAKTQQDKMNILHKHFFGASSPWNKKYIDRILLETKPNELQLTEESLIKSYSNKNKSKKEISYGENFRPHTTAWLNDITFNINTTQFTNLHYDPTKRAIAIDNLFARALPTDDVSFYHYTQAGQGYPFDNLQISAIWAGTPLYVLGKTRDQAWSLVVTPDFIGWVKSGGIAHANNAFIKTWTQAAAKQLIAITKTKTSIVDMNGTYRFSAYVGTFFPGMTISSSGKKTILKKANVKPKTDTKPNAIVRYKVMIPETDLKQDAIIRYAELSSDNATTIPLAPTPHNFSLIMQTLLGRPYGWGNAYFYNDCSSELKNLFLPFGIWLPRHSSEQVRAGKMVDLSGDTPLHRINYLAEHGRPFSTLVYIDGHIFLFIGNFQNPNSAKHEWVPMTFQNMWGLRPHPSTRRAIIGKSVIFPLLLQYPEDSTLVSQAGKTSFQVSQLDEEVSNLLKLEIINLRELIQFSPSP